MEDKNFNIHIDMNVNLTQKDVDDLMCTALEGGICYWCGRAEVVGEMLGDYAHEQISRGGSLILHDAESSDKWELTLEKFLRGVELYIKNGDRVTVEDFKLVDYGELDAEDADCIVQYALFGKLVFG